MQFVKHKDVAAAVIKSQVARSRAGLHLHPGLFTWQQLSVSCVETKYHYSVGSEIARVRKPVGWIKHDAMCMRAFLTFPVDAQALILLRICTFAQTAVAVNWENRHVASGVICDQNKSAARIYIYITGICT